MRCSCGESCCAIAVGAATEARMTAEESGRAMRRRFSMRREVIGGDSLDRDERISCRGAGRAIGIDTPLGAADGSRRLKPLQQGRKARLRRLAGGRAGPPAESAECRWCRAAAADAWAARGAVPAAAPPDAAGAAPARAAAGGGGGGGEGVAAGAGAAAVEEVVAAQVLAQVPGPEPGSAWGSPEAESGRPAARGQVPAPVRSGLRYRP